MMGSGGTGALAESVSFEYLVLGLVQGFVSFGFFPSDAVLGTHLQWLVVVAMIMLRVSNQQWLLMILCFSMHAELSMKAWQGFAILFVTIALLAFNTWARIPQISGDGQHVTYKSPIPTLASLVIYLVMIYMVGVSPTHILLIVMFILYLFYHLLPDKFFFGWSHKIVYETLRDPITRYEKINEGKLQKFAEELKSKLVEDKWQKWCANTLKDINRYSRFGDQKKYYYDTWATLQNEFADKPKEEKAAFMSQFVNTALAGGAYSKPWSDRVFKDDFEANVLEMERHGITKAAVAIDQVEKMNMVQFVDRYLNRVSAWYYLKYDFNKSYLNMIKWFMITVLVFALFNFGVNCYHMYDFMRSKVPADTVDLLVMRANRLFDEIFGNGTGMASPTMERKFTQVDKWVFHMFIDTIVFLITSSAWSVYTFFALKNYYQVKHNQKQIGKCVEKMIDLAHALRSIAKGKLTSIVADPEGLYKTICQFAEEEVDDVVVDNDTKSIIAELKRIGEFERSNGTRMEKAFPQHPLFQMSHSNGMVSIVDGDANVGIGGACAAGIFTVCHNRNYDDDNTSEYAYSPYLQSKFVMKTYKYSKDRDMMVCAHNANLPTYVTRMFDPAKDKYVYILTLVNNVPHFSVTKTVPEDDAHSGVKHWATTQKGFSGSFVFGIDKKVVGIHQGAEMLSNRFVPLTADEALLLNTMQSAKMQRGEIHVPSYVEDSVNWPKLPEPLVEKIVVEQKPETARVYPKTPATPELYKEAPAMGPYEQVHTQAVLERADPRIVYNVEENWVKQLNTGLAANIEAFRSILESELRKVKSDYDKILHETKKAYDDLLQQNTDFFIAKFEEFLSDDVGCDPVDPESDRVEPEGKKHNYHKFPNRFSKKKGKGSSGKSDKNGPRQRKQDHRGNQNQPNEAPVDSQQRPQAPDWVVERWKKLPIRPKQMNYNEIMSLKEWTEQPHRFEDWDVATQKATMKDRGVLKVWPAGNNLAKVIMFVNQGSAEKPHAPNFTTYDGFEMRKFTSASQIPAFVLPAVTEVVYDNVSLAELMFMLDHSYIKFAERKEIRVINPPPSKKHKPTAPEAPKQKSKNKQKKLVKTFEEVKKDAGVKVKGKTPDEIRQERVENEQRIKLNNDLALLDKKQKEFQLKEAELAKRETALKKNENARPPTAAELKEMDDLFWGIKPQQQPTKVEITLADDADPFFASLRNSEGSSSSSQK